MSDLLCEGLTALSNQIRGCGTGEESEKIEKYRTHVQLYKDQFQLYSAQINSLPLHKVLMIFDYSTIHETARFKLKDLNFTAYWRDEKEELCHTYFDFWSKSKKDYNYTVKAFHTLLSMPFFRQFGEIILWGDGGLKTKGNIDVVLSGCRRFLHSDPSKLFCASSRSQRM